tara:strand:- start:479 stop:1240 length:762 start_codon:yes stop_codon:yes gene_type:complete
MDAIQDLTGKVALITGAGQGMGKAIARSLGSLGANLVINDINLKAVKAAESNLKDDGHKVIGVAGDVTSKTDVDHIISSTLQSYGSIHILINNAGILRPTHLIDIEEDEWDLVVNANLKSTYLCSRAVLEPMRKNKWGRIVNLSSSAGRKYSTIGGAHYSAAKAGILGLTRHLAKEEAPNGITVNAICPGLIDTEMVRSTINPERTKEYADSFPIPRLGHPWEVAELVKFIASDQAAYITGAALDINGGDLMM